MRILDIISKETIVADLKAHDKKGVLEELIMPVAGISGISQEELIKVLMERERLRNSARKIEDS